MRTRRRELLTAIVASPLMMTSLLARNRQEPRRMFGLITKIRANPGAGDRLASILIKGSASMPGCLSYVVAADAADSVPRGGRIALRRVDEIAVRKRVTDPGHISIASASG